MAEEEKKKRQWSVKYRPNSFDSVVENETAVNKAKKIVENQDTHAILLGGPTGCGKTTIAKLIASGLTNSRSDIHNENISDKRGIETVRSLIAQSQHLPQGGHRVFILDEVHALLSQAQSAILTTLEEPAHDRVVWILCTNRAHMLSPELLNRLYKINVEKPSLQGLAKHLYKVCKREKAFPKYNEKKVKKICIEVAKSADRVPRESLQLLKELSDGQDKFENIKDLIIHGIRRRTEDSIDKTALQIIMALYSPNKDAEERAMYAMGQMVDKDIWGLMMRLTDIHHELMMSIAGIKSNRAYYYVKELEQQKAIPELHIATTVAVKLVQIKNALPTINDSIHNYVIPEIANIIFKLEKA